MKGIFASLLIALVSVGSVFYVAYQEAEAKYEYELSVTLATLASVSSVVAVSDVHAGTAVLLDRVKEQQSAALRVTAAEQSAQYTEEGVVPAEVLKSAVADNVPTEPEPTPPVVQKDMTLEAKLVAYLNTERVRAGLSSLVVDDTLASIASAHSNDMVARDFFAHASPEDCTLTCRLAEVDYDATAWAENIAQIQKSDLMTTNEIAAHMVESWMKSGSHRENILNDSYTHVGVGVSYDGRTAFATADFALPK